MYVNVYDCPNCTVFVEGKRAGDVHKAEMARVAAEMEKQVDSIARVKAQQRMEVCLLVVWATVFSHSHVHTHNNQQPISACTTYSDSDTHARTYIRTYYPQSTHYFVQFQFP